jgi:hypothetical protein
MIFDRKTMAVSPADTGKLEHITFSPGRATRYSVLYGKYEDLNYGTKYSMTHMSGNVGITFVWSKGDYINLDYFMEKTDIRKADACALLKFLHEKGHSVGVTEDWVDDVISGGVE